MIDLLEKSWIHFGTECIGIEWSKYLKSDLFEIVQCLGGFGLAGIFKRFCEDYQAWSKGMPDLLIWKKDLKLAQLIEVKGPRDRFFFC